MDGRLIFERTMNRTVVLVVFLFAVLTCCSRKKTQSDNDIVGANSGVYPKPIQKDQKELREIQVIKQVLNMPDVIKCSKLELLAGGVNRYLFLDSNHFHDVEPIFQGDLKLK